MALSNLDLEKHRNRRFVIEPWSDDQVSPLGYDLRLGYVINPESAEEIYPKGAEPEDVVDVTIPAKSSVVVVTLERIFLTGKVIGTVHARSGISAKGILVNSVTVDPRWNGRLLLTLYNSSHQELSIRSDKGMATLILHSVETETHKAGHKSETKQLLQDTGRYSPQVVNNILTYLNEYMDTSGEEKYIAARDRTKWYRNQNFFMRKLIYFKEETHWYQLTKILAIVSLFAALVLIIALAFYPPLTEYPILKEISANQTIFTIVIAVAALLVSVLTMMESNGKHKDSNNET